MAGGEGLPENLRQFYRNTKLGDALCEALEMMEADIDEPLREKVLRHFDQVIHQTLSHREHVSAKVNFRACSEVEDKHQLVQGSKINTYRFCDQTWIFDIKNCEVSVGDGSIVLPSTTIIATESAK